MMLPKITIRNILIALVSLHCCADAHAQSFQLDDVELAIWNDPVFKKQFAQSYLAETDIEPRIADDEREKMQKVLEQISANQTDKAVALLDKHRGPTANAIFDFTLANIYFQSEDYDRAAEHYRTAVDKHPKFRRAWRNLGLICVRQAKFDAAVPALARVIELGGGDAITYGLLGFSYSNIENHLSAESAYRMANLLDPATLDWRMGLARSLFRQERHADAASLCGSLIADHPGRADLWLLQANAFLALNQPMRAAENFEFVERLGQSSADSLNMLGDIYVNEDLVDLAIERYLRAMEVDDTARPERAIRAAKVLVARGALSETRRLIEQIETVRRDRLDPQDHKDLLKLQARVALAEGAGDEEARVLQEIVAIDPLDGEALLLLAQHSTRIGDKEQAIFYLERAASLEKFEADAKVRHAQLLVGMGKYEDALPLLRRAQSLKPRDNVQQYLEQVERMARAK